MNRRGFTGTQSPPDDLKARALVREHLLDLDPAVDELVVGCCVGMDAIIGEEGNSLGFKVHGILPSNRSKVAPNWMDWCTSFEAMPDDTDYMDRNDRIVAVSCDLTAFPLYIYKYRSGTWATIDRADKAGLLVKIIALKP